MTPELRDEFDFLWVLEKKAWTLYEPIWVEYEGFLGSLVMVDYKDPELDLLCFETISGKVTGITVTDGGRF